MKQPVEDSYRADTRIREDYPLSPLEDELFPRYTPCYLGASWRPIRQYSYTPTAYYSPIFVEGEDITLG